MGGATTYVEDLEKLLGADWSNLRQARRLSEETRQKLRTTLAGLDSEDSSIVVSGSLARDEFTPGSDIDWTLLIDGSADPHHLDVCREIKANSPLLPRSSRALRKRLARWFSATT